MESDWLRNIKDTKQINGIMYLVNQFATHTNNIHNERLELLFINNTIYAGKLEYRSLLELLVQLNFLNFKNNFIWPTPTGRLFMNKNRTNQSQLSRQQIDLIFTSILFGQNTISKKFEQILDLFKYNQSTFRFEEISTKSSQKQSNLGIRIFLSLLKIINYDHNSKTNFIDPKYNEQIRKRIRIYRYSENENHPTEIDLERSKHAELLIYENEKLRLNLLGLQELSENVELISEYDSSAGFDIKSYNGKGSNLYLHDKFIEVKSSKTSPKKFFMTQNELNTARDLKTQYYIISIGNYEIGKKIEDCEILEVKNPILEVFNLDKFDIKAPKIKFTMK